VASQQPASDFATFYRLHKDPVYRAVLLATKQPERAEDAVADAFTKAYSHWAQVSLHPAPAAWVIRSALNGFRSAWRVWRRELPEIPDVTAAVPPDPGLDSDLLLLVWRLPARQREVVALRLLADLDTRQTAAVLGISPKTVTVHLHRALGQLRAALDSSEHEQYA
jgi:RNA polymerase sigma factor (sigma-70 family)